MKLNQVLIKYKYDNRKKKSIERLLLELPYTFTLTGLISICAHSVLELAQTGEPNEFLRTVTKIGKEE